MTDRVTKFLRKLTTKQQEQVIKTISKIRNNDLAGLDIRPLKGYHNWWRCRVDKVRIIFVKTGSGKNIIFSADFRGQVYKKI